MPKVTFITAGGDTRTLDIPAGWTVMEGAVQNDIREIAAECGGGCACATCHVFIDSAWLEKLGPCAAAEADLLECTAVPRAPNSRLSCQVRLSADLDGLVVHLPARQT